MAQSRRKKRRRGKKIKKSTYMQLWHVTVGIMTIFVLFALWTQLEVSQNAKRNIAKRNDAGAGTVEVDVAAKDAVKEDVDGLSEAEKEIAAYANERGYYLRDYTEDLIALYEKNEEARQFVLDYPMKKDTSFDIDLSQYGDTDTVPLFMQWDDRWGYSEYAGNVFGISGCGPTCLSMVSVYLTKDTSQNPKWMAEFAMENGYYERGSGSKWTLMSEGARKLGLNVKELSPDEEIMAENLAAGNPIICILGPGDFTDSGHFIVLTGYRDGGFVVNDPNRQANSSRIWTFEELRYQIRALWVYWK